MQELRQNESVALPRQDRQEGPECEVLSMSFSVSIGALLPKRNSGIWGDPSVPIAKIIIGDNFFQRSDSGHNKGEFEDRIVFELKLALQSEFG